MKIIKLFTLLLVLFSSFGCKKETTTANTSGSGSAVSDFIKVTFDDKSEQKSIVNSSDNLSELDDDFQKMCLYKSTSFSEQIEICLTYNKYDKDFSTTKSGPYRVLYNDMSSVMNMDLQVKINDQFILKPGSKHTVTSIINKGKDTNNNTIYEVNGVFSCELLNVITNKPSKISGTYKHTIKTLPETVIEEDFIEIISTDGSVVKKNIENVIEDISDIDFLKRRLYKTGDETYGGTEISLIYNKYDGDFKYLKADKYRVVDANTSNFKGLDLQIRLSGRFENICNVPGMGPMPCGFETANFTLQDSDSEHSVTSITKGRTTASGQKIYIIKGKFTSRFNYQKGVSDVNGRYQYTVKLNQ